MHQLRRKLLRTLPEDLRSLAESILQDETAIKIFLTEDRVGVAKKKDIIQKIELRYGGKKGSKEKLERLLAKWGAENRLTEIATYVFKLYTEIERQKKLEAENLELSKKQMASNSQQRLMTRTNSADAAPGHGKTQQKEPEVRVEITPGQNRKVNLLKAALDQVALKEAQKKANGEENDPQAWIREQFWLIFSKEEMEEVSGLDGNFDLSDIKKATIFSGDVLTNYSAILPQYGLMGTNASTNEDSDADERIFWNTNQPSSVYICGLQGSGKSHTLSCLLENCLIQTPALGKLSQPLSGVVLHYSQFTSSTYFHPCEAAFLAIPSPSFPGLASRVNVTVFVSPSNYHALNASYSQIPGVKVKRLLFHPEQLSIATMLQLMAHNTASQTSLYMAQVTRILRDMAARSGRFNYLQFKAMVENLSLLPEQRNVLQQRLGLLESFLDLDGTMSEAEFSFPKGSLTIIDLSCPFVDDNMACVLFDIFLRIYFETDAGNSCGKLVALDEAHRYLTDTPASRTLTTSLLGLIRQQRHFGARIIISSQEPTLDPRLLDLSSMLIMHRFTSPEWANALGKHVPLYADNGVAGGNSASGRSLLERVVRLKTGEAVVFVPSGVVVDEEGVRKVGGELLKLAVRKRVTWDGGHSIVAVD